MKPDEKTVIQLLTEQNRKLDTIITLLQNAHVATPIAPPVAQPIKTMPGKKRKGKVPNTETIAFLAKYLKRPDIPNFFRE